MTRPPQAPNRAATWTLRIMVGGFSALFVTATVTMLVIWYQGRAAKIANLALQSVVTEIYRPHKREVNWYVANLNNAKSIVLENDMIGVLQVGDSVSKKKGQDFYTIRKKGSGETTRIQIVQL